MAEPLENLDPITLARENSIQDRSIEGGTVQWGGYSQRNPMLPLYGTKARDYALLALCRDDMNTMWKGAIAGIIKKLISTPYEIRSPKAYGTYWQRMLMDADLGNGWEVFLSKLIMDYMRYDAGAFIELIGAGDPTEPLLTAPVAIANLDSLRCWLTGDDEYPVWYYSADGKCYKLHYTRVVQLVDTPESDETKRGYGYCSLSRAVATVTKDILMNRYIVQSLDDNPKPGFVVFGNIGDKHVQTAINQWENERATISGGVWGRTVRLYGLDDSQKPTVDFIPMADPPIGFDFPTYQNQLAKEMANALNVDIIEFWELSGGNIGSATQSAVMAQKSRGKAIGTLYKLIERLINSILPDECEFVFEYDDPQADAETAQIASTWVGVVASLSNLLSVDEQRKLLASQVQAIADVITDEDGVITELNDSAIDTPTEQEARIPDTFVSPVSEGDNANYGEKGIASTISDFTKRFKRTVNSFIGNKISNFLARQSLRATLNQEGRKAFIDGLKVAGGTEDEITNEDEITLTRWANDQSDYITRFLGEITDGKITKSNVDNHVNMWINKSLQDAYHKGMEKAGKNKFFIWVYGATEHCPTCLRANGQIHRFKAWANAGVLPQSSALQCKGYNCKCRLVPVTGARLFGKGDLRSVKRTLTKEHHAPALTVYTPPPDYGSVLDRLEQLAQRI